MFLILFFYRIIFDSFGYIIVLYLYSMCLNTVENYFQEWSVITPKIKQSKHKPFLTFKNGV